MVLILGRFTKERKAVLERITDTLRDAGFVPILFDFTLSPERDVTETVQLLANLSCFIIADITEVKSIPQELSHIVQEQRGSPHVHGQEQSEQRAAARRREEDTDESTVGQRDAPEVEQGAAEGQRQQRAPQRAACARRRHPTRRARPRPGRAARSTAGQWRGA